jgi:molybdate/tungstate transport system permease protein
MLPDAWGRFSALLVFLSLPFILLITLPLGELLTSSGLGDLAATIRDPQVLGALGSSIGTSLAAACICLIFGTPLAYLLARRRFPGRRAVEGLVDLPIMIPHPVIGIAILSLVGRNHPLGRALSEVGIEFMGTYTGIITVLTFVGLPFYVNAAKSGFEAVPVRLENVSRSLGAGMGATFARITLPLAWRSMVLGMIMCTARAISEFGAIVIVAYHPMTAPVLIYERFTAYGLDYALPVAVWLVLISFCLFVLMRLFSRPSETGHART